MFKEVMSLEVLNDNIHKYIQDEMRKSGQTYIKMQPVKHVLLQLTT